MINQEIICQLKRRVASSVSKNSVYMYMCTVFHVTFCISVCGRGLGRREDDGSTRPEKEADAGSLWSETDGGR